MRGVALKWAAEGVVVEEPRPATRDELSRVHDRQYLDLIARTAGRAEALDPDTYTSPRSHEIARLAAGAAAAAVEAVMAGPVEHRPRRAAAFVRPPGHHADRRKAMGFCLYNNAAVAAAHALALGASRVAIVDYDVHHGNGTQEIFYEDPHVLYVSTHQYPFYPGTGAAEEVGRGQGRGFTVNIPLEAGATDADYDLVFREVVLPVLNQYAPDLLILSAGFDAHERDPLGGMRVTAEGYGHLTRDLCDVAESCCDGRIVAMTEGGYDLKALGQCLDVLVDVLRQTDARGSSHVASVKAPTSRADAALPRVRAALKPFWKI
jgi:acetoin utilization deacetylase AcuC-like enzyme